MTGESGTGDPAEFIQELLRFAVKHHASDIHIAAGCPPTLRVDGALRSIRLPHPSHPELRATLDTLMSEAQREQWHATGRCMFMYSIAKLAHFRIRIFTQHHGVGAAIRVHPHEVPRLDIFGPPRGFTAVSGRKGAIIVTGPAGCGRTTTLASMLLAIGTFEPCRMVSISRPVEVDLADRIPDLTQVDLTQSPGGYPAAIREAIGAGAQVIAVDDASDPATMIEALRAAREGCLVLCGLRVANTRWAVEEIIRPDPEGQTDRRSILADTLRAVFCQRWVSTVGRGRTLAFEVLPGTPALRSHVRALGSNFAMLSMTQTGVQYGFQTFDQDVQRLWREGRISGDDAASHMLNPRVVEGREGDTGLEPLANLRSAPEEPFGIYSPESLPNLEAFARVARHRDGLIILTGPPSSAQSATAADILRVILARQDRHVVTIEPRVEHAFEKGLKGVGLVTRHVLPSDPVDLVNVVGAALGEDPDVLYLAVEPDAAALKLLLDAANSGVLVLIVLPARSVVAAVESLTERLPASEWRSLNTYDWRPLQLRAVFAQRLVPRAGGGRVPIYEFLIGTPGIRNLLCEQKFQQLQTCFEAGQNFGMQTFAQHIARLVEAGKISADDARLDEPRLDG